NETETRGLREHIRHRRRQSPSAQWVSEDACVHPQDAVGTPWRVAENAELAPGGSGALRCRRCGEMLTGPNGRVTMCERPLNAAGPWMALRHNGDGPNFRLEEICCVSCATLMCVREVCRNGTADRR